MKRRVLRTLGALVGVLMLWYGGGNLVAWLYGRSAVAAWEESFEPLDEVASRFPKTARSEAAEELARLAEPLGLHFGDTWSDTPWPNHPEVSAYVSARIAGDAVEDEAAKKLEAILEAHAEPIAAIRSHLVEAPGLVWRSDIARLYAAPIPKLFAFRQLNDLLIADALARDSTGDVEMAARDLEATWKLVGSIRERGELLSVLTAMAMDLRIHGALRRVSTASEDWAARIAEFDPRAAILRTMKLEAWAFYSLGGKLSLDDFAMISVLGSVSAAEETSRESTRFARWMADPLLRPYFRLCAGSSLRVAGHSVAAFQSADACTFDAAAHDEAVAAAIPAWNWLGRVATPRTSQYYVAAVEHLLSVGLTEKVLSAKAHRRQQGAWPEPTAVPSAVCGDWLWRSEITPEDALQLSLEGDLMGSRERLAPVLSFRTVDGRVTSPSRIR